MPHTGPAGRGFSPSKTVTAAVDSGTSLAVPFFVSGNKTDGTDQSTCSHCIAASSPRRIPVSTKSATAVS